MEAESLRLECLRLAARLAECGAIRSNAEGCGYSADGVVAIAESFAQFLCGARAAGAAAGEAKIAVKVSIDG